jgi:uncharacterized protein (DUF1684 family)
MKKVLLPIILLTLLAIIIYTFTSSKADKAFDEPAWRAKIEQARSQKNRFFKTSENSPLDDSAKTSFRALNYYTPDPAYRIEASISRLNPKELLSLATSDGREKKFYRWGIASFSVHGVEQQLLLLEAAESSPETEGKLFIPFSDNTSARETYGAGRYLDVEKPGGNTLLIDFNEAYSPYCAYSDEYSCPFPPSENQLTVAIRAGEKVYEN